MKARLKRVCKTCTDSSLQTYYYNIKALSKMAGHNEPPNNHRWINSALLKKIKKTLPLMKYKNMTIAGNKALAAYDKKHEEWAKAMHESTADYNKQRDTQKRTKRESDNWPKEGYRALHKLASELYTEVEHLYEKAPAKITMPELWQMMRQFVILFYSKHALRGDLADVRIKRSGANYIEKKKKWHMHIGQHKTVKAHGPIELDIDPTVGKALEKYLIYLRAKTKHGYLLSTKRYGNKLTRKDMMQMIRTTTKDRLGLNIGVQMIRVLKTTDHFKSIDESAKLRGELAHGAGMQWKYVSRK
jgi:hypothetical protein